MLLRELLEQIGTTYDRDRGTSNEVPAQRLLRKGSKAVLRRRLPVGYLTKGSGGNSSASETPWFAILDRDETETVGKGTYLVYLFAIEKRTVSLTLNQGVTDLERQHGLAKARSILAEQASAMRHSVESASRSDLDDSISLGSDRDLGVSYERGNVFARTYPVDDLPSESKLVADLERFRALYTHVLEVRDSTPALSRPPASPPPPAEPASKFKPKDDSEVIRTVRAHTQIVSRKHETLLSEYGKYLKKQSFTVATNVHPRDMTAQHGGKRWLIEAKTVGNNPIQAARDALSQLHFYRYFEDPDPSDVHCVALFNEPIGDSLVAFLDSHNITAVWHEQGNWVGTVPELADYRWDSTHVSIRYRHVSSR